MAWEWPVLGTLGVAGMIDAIYVLRLTLKPAPVRLVEEEACSIADPAACQTLFHTPNAALLGRIPNSALGLVFYLLLIVSAITPVPRWWVVLLSMAATAALGMSIWLFVSLRRRRIVCVPCFIGHGINLVLFLILLRLL